ncbi:alpha/beta fold hydrolase [Hymenobacter aerilatus]|uniref:Alpha/beta fold hydrolase n=1 Tax=Hymenobacter aerilatus TaxID=2932251 RepID=A0A8T9STU5_9BACT|nr:alpha/beta fold hydrolase [Hymenobacter aerilatus]UOR05255.1 alpha/beta fold hydrolase [Hymenobacter aerilatus]
MPQQPTLVFLHGFIESRDIWTDFTRDFPDAYPVFVPDLLGHGSNSVPVANYSMRAQAEYVAEQLRQQQIEKAVLIGHSMGGYIALALAEQRPELVAGLCLFNSSALADTEEKKQAREKNIDFIERHGVEKFMNSFVRPLFSPAHRDSMPEQLRMLEDIGKATPKETFIGGLRAMAARADRTQVLREAQFPVLVIAGKDDVAVPFEQSVEVAQLAPVTYALFLAEVGHLAYLEAPERTRQAILDLAAVCKELGS